MKLFLISCTFLLCLTCTSQILLKKNASPYFLHPDTDTIHATLNFLMDGIEPGPKTGSHIDFFKLYNSKNDSLDIALELSKGKSVFLIGGSYTCPNYRNEITFLDSLAALYKNEVSFFVIYTIEPHPHYPDLSPYLNEHSVVSANIRDTVLYNQPKTYGQRKWLAEKMISKTNLKIPVFIDSPSNQWLNTFGAMPNMAYLINTNGKVLLKYLSYNNSREEIKRDLKLLPHKKGHRS